MFILLCLYLGSGVLFVILSFPLLAKKIKPNPFYGFRVKKTLENPDFWYATNAYFAKRQLLVGLGTMIASLGLYFWPGLAWAWTPMLWPAWQYSRSFLDSRSCRAWHT